MPIDRRRFLEGAGALALTGISLIGLTGPQLTGFGGFVTRAEAQTVSDVKLMAPGALPDMVLGKPDAPVTIVEYASMTCGHCAHFHTTTFPVLKSKYIDTGKVKLILREFPLDIAAKAAFMLARCAGPDKYYPMVSAMFETQKDWAFGGNPAAGLLTLAKQAGMSEDQFKACLSDAQLAANVDQVAQRAAEEFGVDATPTFFVNGKKYSGALSPEDLDQALTPLLGAN